MVFRIAESLGARHRALQPGKAGRMLCGVKILPNQEFPKARPSVSAAASRSAERRRLLTMTVEERIREALSLHLRFRDLIAKAKDSSNGSGV
jgi:hypothetical protein